MKVKLWLVNNDSNLTTIRGRHVACFQCFNVVTDPTLQERIEELDDRFFT